MNLQVPFLIFAVLWTVFAGVLTDSAILYAQDDGLEAQVWEVDIRGNETFSDLVIKQNIATSAPTFFQKISFWSRGSTSYDETEIRKDVIRIRRYYQRRGFIHVEVSNRVEPAGGKQWKKRVVFIIKENSPVRINSVAYEYQTDPGHQKIIKENSAFQRAKQRHPFQPGNRYGVINEPEVVGTLIDQLKNLGYAYAEVDIEADIDSVANTANLSLLINPGPRSYLDRIIVEGEKSVSKSLVVRESGLKSGELFSQNDLQEAQKELFNNHLFRFATISIPEQEQDTTIDLQIRVRESPLRTVQASIGFGTEDYARGQLSWTHHNVARKGHRFTVSGRASFIEQTANIDYLFPYLLNTKSSLVVSPFFQHLDEKSFELIRGGITNSFIYRYSDYLTGTASYQYTKNKEFTQQLNVDLPDTTQRYDLSSIQFTGYYGAGFSRQQMGWVVRPFLEISGLFGAATFSFQKASIDVRRFTRLSSTTVLATRIEGGSIISAGQDSLPSNIRYFLGGTSSVRGWLRQELGPKRALVDSTGFVEYVPVGGRTFFGFNVEIRQELNFFIRGFGIAAFLDGGQVWRKRADFSERAMQFGVGGGIRYQSPIGPLRLDVGFKLNPTPEDLNKFQGRDFNQGLETFAIHFSIGQAF